MLACWFCTDSNLFWPKKIEFISWQIDLVRVDLVTTSSHDTFISWYESWSGGSWSHENWSPERKPISCIGSKFTRMSTHPRVTFAWLMVCTCGVIEAQPQALCTSEVQNFGSYGPYKAALWASGVHSASYTMLTVTWCCSKCCVLSGLDSKVAGYPGVCYCL